MPILQRPKEGIKLVLPPRKATLAAKTNVLVIGGGPAGKGTILRKLPKGEAYDIPLRCLIPRTADK